MRLPGGAQRAMAVITAAVFAGVGTGSYVYHRYNGAGSGCPSVEVAFARGTGEPPGLGSVGRSFVSNLTQQLAGTKVHDYAVDYRADDDQISVGPGSVDLVDHLRTRAVACPGTRFVLAGYSQGASVVDLAIGLFGVGGEQLPPELDSRVKALVVFGNPLGLLGRTVETASATFGLVAKSYCSAGDPVCGGGLDMHAHDSYVSDGSTRGAAEFVADRLR